jgi:tetratricopeptide (TPR) repeat protein
MISFADGARIEKCGSEAVVLAVEECEPFQATLHSQGQGSKKVLQIQLTAAAEPVPLLVRQVVSAGVVASLLSLVMTDGGAGDGAGDAGESVPVELGREAMACLRTLAKLGAVEAKEVVAQEQEHRLSRGAIVPAGSVLLQLLALGFATNAWLEANIEKTDVYLWPTAGQLKENEDDEEDGAKVWTLMGSDRINESLRSFRVEPRDFEVPRWWDESATKDTLAAVAALNHIAEHNLHTVCRGFIHPDPASTEKLQTGARGLSRQFFIDFKRQFKLPDDMPVLVVLHMMRFLTAGTGRSFAELMQGQKDANGKPYLSDATLFVSHFTGYVLAEDIDAIDIFEKQEGQHYYSFVDVFAINQNEVCAAGEIMTLKAVIEQAKTTLLVLTPWHDPGVIRRVWCLAETMWTLQLDCALRVALCSKEQESLLAALRGQHPDGLTAASVLESVFVIDAAKAEATKASDQAMIFGWIEEEVEGGIDALNMRVKAGLRTALVEAVASEAKAAANQEDETLMFGVGIFFEDMGRYEEALEYYQRALRIEEQAHGKDHISSANNIHCIARMYSEKGQYEEALEYGQRALRIQEEAHGKDHISSAGTICYIAKVYSAKGQSEEAMDYYQRCLRIQEEAHSKDHISNASTIGKIASVCRKKGQYEEALEYYQRCLQIEEEAHGENHISSARTIDKIASEYSNKGQYEEALEYYQRALRIEEQAHGKDHISSASAIGKIASVCRKKGQYDEAMEYYQRVLRIEEQAHGENHIRSALTINCVARLYRKKGQYEEAMEYYQRALRIQEEAHGKDHISSALTINCVARMCHDKGQYEEALEYNQRALRIEEQAHGKDHISSASTIGNIANVYYVKGQCDEALEYYQRALRIEEEAHGKDHISSANNIHCIARMYHMKASVYDETGQYEEALEYYQRVLRIEEQAHGENHISSASTICDIANVYEEKGQYEEAMEYNQRALRIEEEAHGKDHISSASAIGNIANVYYVKGQCDEALEYYQRALRIEEEAHGENHIRSENTIFAIASVYKDKGQYEEAIIWRRRLVSILEGGLGAGHARAAEARRELKGAERSWRRRWRKWRGGRR